MCLIGYNRIAYSVGETKVDHVLRAETLNRWTHHNHRCVRLRLSKVLRPTRHILGHLGDGGLTTATARIIAAASPTVCAVLSSVCATTVDNSGVYVYYLKGIVSVCFRCPARTVGFSGIRLHLCMYNQLS